MSKLHVLLQVLAVSVTCYAKVDVDKFLTENSNAIAGARKAVTLPRGTILMVASSQVDKWFNLLGEGIGEYAGWYLCDGRNGTPDLRGRFVVGRDALNQNSDYANIGATGGASHVTLTADTIPAHSHSFQGTTATAGQHSHSYNDMWHPDPHYVDANNQFPWCASSHGCAKVPLHAIVAFNSYDRNWKYEWAQQISRETVANGQHTHTITGTTDTIGASKAHENRPPYYVAVYIIYIGR